jgi:MinD-like ATPase involved in chromosome partitioning or flagellar assembly
MAKHKVGISMKSNFAFDRFTVMFGKVEVYRKSLDVYPDNLNTFEGIEDLLEFWKPELFILDTKLTELARIEDLLNRNDIPIIRFDSDFETATEQVNRQFTLVIEEEPEEEQSQDITYIKDTEDKPKEVIIKDRIIEKEILRTEYTAMNNKIIVVASMWSGAGSTTFATNLARAISERGLEVSYVEYPLAKPYMFDYLCIPEKEYEDVTYIDVAREIKEAGSRKNKRKNWKEAGVNWFVTDTRKEPLQSFEYEDMLKYIYSLHSVVTIVDISANLNDSSIQKFLHHADEIFVCVEPDPVKIDWLSTITHEGKETPTQRKEQQIIKFLNEINKREGIEYQFITMKYSSIINLEEWLSCLEKEPLCYFPSIPYDGIINSVWESTFLYDHEEYTEAIERALKPVIVKMLPREFYSLNKEKKKKSLLNFLKKGER